MIPLFCQVCKERVPEDRVARNATTCSGACHRKLRIAKRAALRKTKCPGCGIPSTPAERRLFRRWRDSLGEQRGRGRPKKIAWAKRLAEMGIEWPKKAAEVLVFDASSSLVATVTREDFEQARAAASPEAA